MGLEKRGYAGKVLYVDLGREVHHTELLKEDVVQLLLGGKGLGALLLYRLLEKGVDPLSPRNPLIFATGPLTGTMAPGSGRFCVVTKSPATGTINDSYCGGFFGSELKMSGCDALVLLGKASEPSILVIDDGDVYVEPAGDITLVELPGGEGVLTTGPIQAQHAYGDNGTYTVTVRVRDDDMAAGT